MASQLTIPTQYQISKFDDKHREIYDGKLWRSFSKEEHAEQFLRGQIRFMSLQFYRELEGERGDCNEGGITSTQTSILRANGKVVGNVSRLSATMENVHEYFISCYSKSEPRQKDEIFVVEIESACKFAEKLHLARSSSGEILGKEFISYRPIIYYNENDPAMLTTDDDRFYKTENYAPEDEYRFMVALIGFPISSKDSALIIDAGDLNGIAKML